MIRLFSQNVIYIITLCVYNHAKVFFLIFSVALANLNDQTNIIPCLKIISSLKTNLESFQTHLKCVTICHNLSQAKCDAIFWPRIKDFNNIKFLHITIEIVNEEEKVTHLQILEGTACNAGKLLAPA